MKKNKLFILTFSVLIFMITACTSYDTTAMDWKTKNDSYFINMKDTAGYILYNIPASSVGGSYYYKIIKPGEINGLSPGINAVVTVNYRGSLINGTVFDQTYTGTSPVNNYGTKPVSFSVAGVISGWTKNLMQMKVGEIRSVVLPQELAYGAQGAGSTIPPYSVLRFDIQLISYK
jgi:hypothetical protein